MLYICICLLFRAGYLLCLLFRRGYLLCLWFVSVCLCCSGLGTCSVVCLCLCCSGQGSCSVVCLSVCCSGLGTCFGEVLLVVAEVLEEGDALDGRVVAPRRLQQHDLRAEGSALSDRSPRDTKLWSMGPLASVCRQRRGGREADIKSCSLPPQ